MSATGHPSLTIMSSTTVAPTTYQIIVDGWLNPRAASHFNCQNIATDSATTALTVTVSDQTELHGILAYLRDYNHVLVQLTRLPAHSLPVR